MKYCIECGNELIEKECDIDGMIPYCPVCKQFRFPTFNSAISTLIFNPDKDKILLIQQYGKKANILVAGYINKGENAKEALLREVKEEVNLKVIKYIYNDNIFFEKSNTLIHNYITYVDSEEYALTDEVDQANWFSIKDAIKQIKEKSLAKNFLFKALLKLDKVSLLFHYEEDHIFMLDSEDKQVAEIVFPHNNNNNTYSITKTFVDDTLRGNAIADKLMQAVYELIKTKQGKCTPICSYALKWFEKHPECKDILNSH